MDTKKLEEAVQESTKYAGELFKWQESHIGSFNQLSKEQELFFVHSALAMFSDEPIVLLIAREGMENLMSLAYLLGCRSGWEAAKLDNLAKEMKK